MRIALDAMGSDEAPRPDIEGAIMAAREYGDTIVLIGDEKLISAEMAGHNTSGLQLEICHAPETITMLDKPTQVGRSKPNSSIHIACRMISEGRADAFVSAGNTGAILTIATLHTLKRIRGVKRPALSSLITVQGNPMMLIDIGANSESKPEWMLQFAVMGAAYAQHALKIDKPRVGLLSNGEEEGKGTEQIRETAKILQASDLNFTGNVEPKEVLGGAVDVMVSDGFSGNIFIKSLEAMGSVIFDMIREDISTYTRSKIGALLLKPGFRRVYKQIDPFEIGGAPLLGVNGVVIIGHGRTNALGIKNCIRQARLAVQGNIIDVIQGRFADLAGQKMKME